MYVSTRPTTDITYSIPETGGIYLYVADEQDGETQFAFHPEQRADALDRLEALIDTATALRDAYRRKVEAEAAEMREQEAITELEDALYDNRHSSPDAVAA